MLLGFGIGSLIGWFMNSSTEDDEPKYSLNDNVFTLQVDKEASLAIFKLAGELGYKFGAGEEYASWGASILIDHLKDFVSRLGADEDITGLGKLIMDDDQNKIVWANEYIFDVAIMVYYVKGDLGQMFAGVKMMDKIETMILNRVKTDSMFNPLGKDQYTCDFLTRRYRQNPRVLSLAAKDPSCSEAFLKFVEETREDTINWILNRYLCIEHEK